MGRSRKRKKTDEQKCQRKLCYGDYLSALLHARGLADEKLIIYPCIVCGGIHVGHDRTGYAVHCEREGQAKVAALLRRIEMHEHVMAKHGRAVIRLRDELESIVIYYGCCLDILDGGSINAAP